MVINLSFGDGSDGDVTISVNTTLTADKNYNNLTVNAGVTLYPDGYVIYVLGTLTLNGTIARNGNNGSNCSGDNGGGGGAALPNRTVGGSAAGGTGGNCDSDVGECFAAGAGNLISDGIAGSSSGAGATYSGAHCTGAAGAGKSTTNTHSIVCNDLADIITNATSRKGGPGGGGGGSYVDAQYDGSGGGGGGSGGGVIFISASTITGAGPISANGGTGGSGGGSGGTGGGGAVVIEYSVKTNYTGTVSVTGGSVGTITYCEVSVGWTGKIGGVTNPNKVMGIDVSNIAKVMGM